MPAEMPAWPFPILSPPRIRQVGTPVHGDIPVERWRALGFWCVHAYRYSARLRLDEAWLDIEPGMVSVFPPSIDIEYHYRGPSPHAFVHFDLPRAGAGNVPVIPALMSLGTHFDGFDADLRQSVAWLPAQPARAQARVWDLLWRLTAFSEASPAGEPVPNRTARRAVEWIEVRLSQPFRIADLATHLDISHAHLVRLFQTHLGASPLDYVHGRRARRAEHLLRHTTLPLKSIARQVGLADLQQLNKRLRRTLGKSPRAIRAAATGSERLGPHEVTPTSV